MIDIMYNMKKIDRDSIFSYPTIRLIENDCINEYKIDLCDEAKMVNVDGIVLPLVFVKEKAISIPIYDMVYDDKHLYFSSNELNLKLKASVYINKEPFYILENQHGRYKTIPIFINGLEKSKEKPIKTIYIFHS